MRILFNVTFLLFSIFYIPTLFFKGRLHRHFLQRFGVFEKDILNWFSQAKEVLWIHAVSVGEVQVVKYLIDKIKEEMPEKNIVLSTTTRTGYHLAKRFIAKDVMVIYFPLDFSFTVRAAVEKIHPSLFVMMETEIWPNLIIELSDRKVPIALLNGRISDRSYNKYMAIRLLLKPTIDRITRFAMQTERDVERIKAIGADEGQVTATGNMKFDSGITQDILSEERRIDLAKGIRESLLLSPDEDIIITGSTHTGEEEILLNAYMRLREEFPHLRLLIAPRHVERVRRLEHTIRKMGIKSARTSYFMRNEISDDKKEEKSKQECIFLLNTIGELKNMYSMATIVFMGGSLVKRGGHNLIEPAAFGRPIIFGTHMFNFRDMSELFLDSDAAIRVANEGELQEACGLLLRDPEKRREMGEAAKKLINDNMGATDRDLNILKELSTKRAE